MSNGRFKPKYTLTSVCIFSVLFLFISGGADKENLFNDQEPLKLVITAFTNSHDLCF